MSTITTHVLDTSLGKPAEGIRIELEYGGAIVGSGVTDADGRARDLVPKSATLDAGDYRLTVFVGEYFSRVNRESFYTQIVVRFLMGESHGDYHVPRLPSQVGQS